MPSYDDEPVSLPMQRSSVGIVVVLMVLIGLSPLATSASGLTILNTQALVSAGVTVALAMLLAVTRAKWVAVLVILRALAGIALQGWLLRNLLATSRHRVMMGIFGGGIFIDLLVIILLIRPSIWRTLK